MNGLEQSLNELLRDSGSRLSSADLEEIVAGVAAAPRAVDPDRWMVLVGDQLTPAMQEKLRSLLAEERERLDRVETARPPVTDRLAALRAELARRDLDGFLIPLADEHQSEFPPRRTRRLEWLTDFSGSAGMAVVMADKAALFVDGRYTLQARHQVDAGLFEQNNITLKLVHHWVAENAGEGARIAYDPWLHSPDRLVVLRESAARAGAILVPTEPNPVDVVWTEQPAAPIAPVEIHPVLYAGRESGEKRDEAVASLVQKGASSLILSAPDSINWLLNIRGGETPNTPAALGFVVLGVDGPVDLFTDPRKFTAGTRAHLGDAVTIRPPAELGVYLDALGEAGQTVLTPSGSTPAWIVERLNEAGAELISGEDPCVMPKACKNSVEVQGTRNAHIRDGAALCRFLAWLAVEAPKGTVDEIGAVAALYDFRAVGDLFRGLSFETISGAGPNGAIVHYRVAPETNRTLEPGSLYLVDSGALYLDGTTDVTRTLAIGEPDAEMRDRFTRVLKGHLAVAAARFPVRTSGGQLDSLARAALWQVGLDYEHGTGHGVGSYLGVHEGPQRIAKRFSDVPLRPGMVISNEPGYYKTGSWGIRIENLEVVRQAPPIDGGELETLMFETLTLVPIDLALVEPALMTTAEIDWLNAYHARVRETITPLVDAATADWLKEATRAIAF